MSCDCGGTPPCPHDLDGGILDERSPDAALVDRAWRASGLDQRHFAKILNTGKRELVRMRLGKRDVDERTKAVCLALLESKGES